MRAAWEKNTDTRYLRLGRLGCGAVDERERPNNAKKKCLGNHKFLTAFRQGCIGKPSNSIFLGQISIANEPWAHYVGAF